MRYRKLRIAWSVAWGVSAALLIVLWVRSFSYWDQLVKPRTFVLESFQGYVGIYNQSVFIQPWMKHWEHLTCPSDFKALDTWQRATPYPRTLGFVFRWDSTERGLTFPLLLPIALAFALASAPFIRRQFSLRTLPIATTLVAVVLGLAVYAARK